MTSQTLYDPPSGWRYGFTKPYAPEPGESLADTLLRDGYPQSEIDAGNAKHCRFIGWDANEVDTTARTAVEHNPEREHLSAGNDNAPERDRLGDWMQTYTGRAVYPMDLRPEDICIEDIAHALSMLCRYNGHGLRFYSVAEHSVLIARALRRYGDYWALEGLMHDATEAYLADVPRPIKPFLPGYKEAEVRAAKAISDRFNLDVYDVHEIVHEYDNRILHDERIQNMARSEKDWSLTGVRLGVTLQFWSPERANAEFLGLFAELYGEE